MQMRFFEPTYDETILLITQAALSQIPVAWLPEDEKSLLRDLIGCSWATRIATEMTCRGGNPLPVAT